MKKKRQETTTNLYIIKELIYWQRKQGIHDVEHEKKQKKEREKKKEKRKNKNTRRR